MLPALSTRLFCARLTSWLDAFPAGHYTSAVLFTIHDRLLRPPRLRPGYRLGGYLGRLRQSRSSMSRRCDLTGKAAQVGHKVSHSNIKTKRRFLPNLVNVTFISEALGRNVRLRVSTNAVKSVDHNGGLDAFLLKTSADVLSPRALELKRAIQKKVGEAAPVAKAS